MRVGAEAALEQVGRAPADIGVLPGEIARRVVRHVRARGIGALRGGEDAAHLAVHRAVPVERSLAAEGELADLLEPVVRGLAEIVLALAEPGLALREEGTLEAERGRQLVAFVVVVGGHLQRQLGCRERAGGDAGQQREKVGSGGESRSPHVVISSTFSFLLAARLCPRAVEI